MKIIITPELAEICGIHIGEGYLRNDGKRRELDISGGMDEIDYYDNHVKPLFENFFNIEIGTREFPARGTYGFVIRDRNVIEYFQKLGFPSGTKSAIVEIPPIIFNHKNREIKAAVLRGIFDTDGCVAFRASTQSQYIQFKRTHKYYPRLNISTVSKPLFEQLCMLLKEFGFKIWSGQYTPKNKKWSMSYNIWLYGKANLEKWVREIGFNNPKNTTKYLIWKEYGYYSQDLIKKGLVV